MTAEVVRQGTAVVGVGDCRIASPPAVALATYALGSCIAVLAWDWKLKMGGLLHVMLPDSSIDLSRASANPCAYVDTGVPTLYRELIARGSAKNQLRWCLAGGAGMMADSAHFEIGKRNHMAIKKTFWKLGLFVAQEDVGGSESRSVRLDLQTGRIGLRRGNNPEQTLSIPALSLMKGTNDGSIAR